MASPDVKRVYMGIESDHGGDARSQEHSLQNTATFKPCSASTSQWTPGGIVALIGANGAGKSTFLKAIAGQMANKQGEIRFEDREIGLLSSDEIVATGIAMVPEGRRLFRSSPSKRISRSAPSRAETRAMDARHGLCPVPRPERTPAERGDRAIGGPAADGRDRPRPDVEPSPSPLR